ncbi:Sulfotransferase domain protein [Posidoniimonas polymericola]|uniref:Sulfotransferase domain protein n=1 Tax=Posidoniimonas polymericola TaxID=2528002 RepID=A0A5C5YQE4_9BACT|nr:sulfotransferase [Posidoniimonas polymericola]TWT77018.1 Sulfotransferase domain protein [Posidoniimonas polymericola]
MAQLRIQDAAPLWSTRRLAAAGPLTKMAVWIAGTAAIAALTQVGASLLGVDFWILDKSAGAGVLIVVALSLLLGLLSIEGRPMADYGLVAEANWWRQVLRGAAVGGGAYALLVGWAWLAGVAHYTGEPVTASRSAKMLLAVLAAGPVAAAQQIIFAGYLVSILRDRHSRAVSVIIPAALFGLVAAASRLSDPLAGPLFVSMFLIASLLGLLRLRTGSIMLPTGLLAGPIAVRALLSKSRLLWFTVEDPNAWWFAPYGDPRLGVAMWSLLAVGVAWAAYDLARHGEHKAVSDAEADAAFKRVLPFSNLLSFTPIDRWAVLLWQARFRVGLKYLPRLVVTLIASALNTIISLPERLLCPLLLRRDPPDPVFIVGMPRSGTTHLHNLLSLDPRFRSPRNYEVFNPHGFLTGWTTTACLTPILTWRRPMDSMQMTVMSSQEEEFALAAMGSPSPYWGFEFPREISRHDAYWQPEGFTAGEERVWARHYKLLLRKLTCFKRRTPLLKNPANTGRVKLLRKHFPAAKFIHIVRHPHDVYRSNQRLASHGLVVFQLQDPHPADNYATRCLENYRSLMDAYYDDTRDAPAESAVEVRYEDLVADPLGAIRQAYAALGMTVTPEFEQRLNRYLDSVSHYRKNRFATLSADEQAEVDGAMAPYLQQWGYTEERRIAA